jgi:hypothetical protein
MCSLPGQETGEVIPAGQEKELDLGLVAFSRNIHPTEQPASYMLRIKYRSPSEQEFFLYTDEFRIGSAALTGEFQVVVDQAASDVLSFHIVNNSEKSIWLSSPCSTGQLLSGRMDEEHSMLQCLTEAGSWSYIRPQAGGCGNAIQPIEISSGEVRRIDGAQWLQNAGIALSTGHCRWDLVFYLGRTANGLEMGHHVFSQDFDFYN